ncbi:MAG TPA: nuclear transport factor 2 family protein [Sphingobacteriaceae bacterium]|nr:nuclear transport factor 2 family protein [Sphingobacteriaceae bacterium]
MKVLCAEDCGNAPKKALLRDVTIDYWGGDGQLMLENLADGAVWTVVGQAPAEGIQAIVEHRAGDRSDKPVELQIHNIITHGNVASLNATVLRQDGSRLEYCDVFRFSGFGKKAKIKEITSYRIFSNRDAEY